MRRIAAEIGLPNARKKDSTGICFIGERPFREFLDRYLANAPGPIEDDRGRTIGEHVGLSFYTLGQRKGIGIGGLKDAAARARRRRARALVRRAQGRGAQRPARRRRATTIPGCCRAGSSPTMPAGSPDRRRRRGRYAAKTRYRQADAACALRPAAAPARVELVFDPPQWAVTPGQSAVVYDGEVCLGGAVIAASDAHNGGAPESTARRDGSPVVAR